MEFQNENANFCRKTDHPKELHFFGICDSKRHFFFVGFAPGSDIFCYVTSLYSHMHELEKHGCAMLIKKCNEDSKFLQDVHFSK